MQALTLTPRQQAELYDAACIQCEQLRAKADAAAAAESWTLLRALTYRAVVLEQTLRLLEASSVAVSR